MPEIDRARTTKTPISEDPTEPSIAGALEVAARFGLKSEVARAILREVFIAVSGWRTAGRRLRLKATTLGAYASAFDHELADETRRLLKESSCARHIRRACCLAVNSVFPLQPLAVVRPRGWSIAPSNRRDVTTRQTSTCLVSNRQQRVKPARFSG